MEEALYSGQFEVLFQPQYDSTDNSLVGAEALIRWNHPTDGMISPSEFIPVFEKNGFIYQLDSFVCKEVCRFMAKWKENGKAIPISINLSRVDLQNPKLIHMLVSSLQEYGISREWLHLEITESAYVDAAGGVNKIIDELRSLGFIIEMDDFGHGYSSLNMLKDVAVDVLKLDMGFLDQETNMDKGGNVIEVLVRLVHSMGILVIAEGVENEREVNFLQSINCNLMTRGGR